MTTPRAVRSPISERPPFAQQLVLPFFPCTTPSAAWALAEISAIVDRRRRIAERYEELRRDPDAIAWGGLRTEAVLDLGWAA